MRTSAAVLRRAAGSSAAANHQVQVSGRQQQQSLLLAAAGLVPRGDALGPHHVRWFASATRASLSGGFSSPFDDELFQRDLREMESRRGRGGGEQNRQGQRGGGGGFGRRDGARRGNELDFQHSRSRGHFGRGDGDSGEPDQGYGFGGRDQGFGGGRVGNGGRFALERRGGRDDNRRFGSGGGRGRSGDRFGGGRGGRGGRGDRFGDFDRPGGRGGRGAASQFRGGDRDDFEDAIDPFEGIEKVASGIDFDAYDDVEVKITGRDAPAADDHPSTFAEMADSILHPHEKKIVEKLGFSKPTPVQRHSIPIVASGRDIMTSSQTGSGKTAAFLLPTVSKILGDEHYRAPAHRSRWGPQAMPRILILAPTRELASQIQGEARTLLRGTALSAEAVYGGTKINTQINALARLQRQRGGSGSVDILVATPGRLSDMMERGVVSLAEVQYLIMDEADRMLDMGFEPQIRQIVEESDMPPSAAAAPVDAAVVTEDASLDPFGAGTAPSEAKTRTTMMFSATFPKEIRELAGDFMHDYIFLAVGRIGSATELVEQKFIECPGRVPAKVDLIHEVLGEGSAAGSSALIFTETKRMAEMVAFYLSEKGLDVDAIHGDRSQQQRAKTMRRFALGKLQVMVATNVAARGIDVKVDHVINFESPQTIDDYVHRVGRTGRAGRKGLATTFVGPSTSIAKELVAAASESTLSEVPDWLREMVPARRAGGGGRRGGGGGRGFSRGFGRNRNGGRRNWSRR